MVLFISRHPRQAGHRLLHLARTAVCTYNVDAADRSTVSLLKTGNDVLAKIQGVIALTPVFHRTRSMQAPNALTVVYLTSRAITSLINLEAIRVTIIYFS